MAIADVAPPAWQQGYALPWLRALVAPLQATARPYALGAFDLPKERDVAAALAAKHVAFHRDAGGQVTATLLFRPYQVPVTHTDWLGRSLRIPAGTVHGGHWGSGDPTLLAPMLAGVQHRVGAACCTLELFTEDEATVAAGLQAGFRPLLTKIAASSALRVLLGRGPGLPDPLPAPEPVEHLTLAVVRPDWLRPAEQQAVEQELHHYVGHGGQWAQHYSSYNVRHSWTSFALCGYDPMDPLFIIKPGEMAQSWKRAHPAWVTMRCGPTSAWAAFPTVQALVARLPAAPQRVRLMRLTPDGELARHADITDREAGVADGRIARFHVPLLTSSACQFRAWNHLGQATDMHWPMGSLCYLDQRKPHAVRNPAHSERIHLVIDLVSTPAVRELLRGAVYVGL